MDNQQATRHPPTQMLPKGYALEHREKTFRKGPPHLSEHDRVHNQMVNAISTGALFRSTRGASRVHVSTNSMECSTSSFSMRLKPRSPGHRWAHAVSGDRRLLSLYIWMGPTGRYQRRGQPDREIEVCCQSYCLVWGLGLVYGLLRI